MFHSSKTGIARCGLEFERLYLSPSGSFPAQARLALNGSHCGDIMRWQVGLRFKERAIIKLKYASLAISRPMLQDWDFPVKPT